MTTPPQTGKGEELKMSEESKAYTVVPVGEGCSHCNAGEHWDVVFRNGTDEEFALSTSYGDEEEAEEIADLCNSAYEKGRTESAELSAVKGKLSRWEEFAKEIIRIDDQGDSPRWNYWAPKMRELLGPSTTSQREEKEQ